MGGIESQAAFYRGYLTDDQSLRPLAVALATMVALWSLVYLVGCCAPVEKPPVSEPAGPSSALAAWRIAP